MPTVVLSEGKHDVDFLSLVHDRHVPRNYDTFIDPEMDSSQDRRIRLHKIDQNSEDESVEYLYKAEGGRSKVVKKFRSHATEFSDFELILFVDFDKEGLSDFMDYLHDKLDEHYSGALQVVPHEILNNDDMRFFKCDLQIHSNIQDKFKLIAFHDDLEAAANICDNQDRATQRNHIDQYLDNNGGICSDLLDFIFNFDL